MYILFPITFQVLQQASKVHVCELFHVCVAISTSVVLAHFKFPICAETSVSWQSAVLMNLWRPQKRSLSSLSQVSLLGTCFASFGKPFKLKTPKDRTAVSSVLSLSLAHAEGRLQQRTYPLKMSIHLISEVPGAALCAYCSCMLECSGTD